MVSDHSHAQGRFYADLPVFTEFSGVAEGKSYARLPDGWVLLAADIVRSRDALAAGNYKTVNMIAAAAVAAVLNASRNTELPFVFGGDGAMAAVPPHLAEETGQALAGVRVIARETEGLDLRVAAIPIADLRRAGADLRVAKLQLSEGNNLAMFSGGGIAMAEKILKDPERVSPYRLRESDGGAATVLDGLSCRWEPVPAEQGHIVTLMLRPQDPAPEALARLIADLDRLLENEFSGAVPGSAPVRRTSLRFRFPPSGLLREARAVGARRGFWRVLSRAILEALAFVVAVTFRRRIGPLEPERYLDEVTRNTDFRKFDDTLRLVLDLNQSQLDALDTYLREGEADGRLVYGMHVSRSALMTCLVFSIEESRHVHFVDGSGGGFSRAASDFDVRAAAAARRSATQGDSDAERRVVGKALGLGG
ncbi:DUF3095 domain-containing protein [Stappia sp. ES.058]|uniref:DUF3095 domain-containing protein n=1 Tax=Stappia sp. ES.058 TaxID=1881061 RepID=UPI00087DACBB|nr:DUF3095 domain-containing protein [Stappia sp. ES.058]SDT92982.1 Protein of unknown function [Stappia sp. ES.058]